MYKNRKPFLAIGFLCCMGTVLAACAKTQTKSHVSENGGSETVFAGTEETGHAETEEIAAETEIAKELTEEERLEIKYEKFDYKSYAEDVTGWTKEDYRAARDSIEDFMSGEAYQDWYAENGDLVDESQTYTVDEFAIDGREYGLLWYHWSSSETSFGYYFLDDPSVDYTASINRGKDYQEIGVYDLFELYLESSQSYYANYTNDKKIACDEDLNAYYVAMNQQYMQTQSQAQDSIKETKEEARFSLSEFELKMRVSTQLEWYLKDYFDVSGVNNLKTEIVEAVDVGPVVYNMLDCEEYLIKGNVGCSTNTGFYKGTFSMTLYACSINTWSEIYAVMMPD